MPLGDPGGGDFEYTDEGLPTGIHAVEIPVTDLRRAAGFYEEILGFAVLGEDGGRVYLERGACRVVLRLSAEAGVDAGVWFSVGSPYDTRRRLIDEGVEFVEDPARGPLGVSVAVRDPDGNVLRMVGPAEFRPGTSS